MFEIWITVCTIAAIIAAVFGVRFLFFLVMFLVGGIGASGYLVFRLSRWLLRG